MLDSRPCIFFIIIQILEKVQIAIRTPVSQLEDNGLDGESDPRLITKHQRFG